MILPNNNEIIKNIDLQKNDDVVGPRHFKSRQDQFESEFVKLKLKDFNYKNCRAWTSLTTRYGYKISQSGLLSLAEVVSSHLNLDLFREYKRRKEMLIKWFDENYELIWPFIENHVTVFDINGASI